VRVLFLTRYGERAASSRQRCYQFLPLLAEAAIQAEVSPLLSDDYVVSLNAGRSPRLTRIATAYLRRLGVLLRIRGRYDLVWIEKEALPWLPAWPELALFKLAGVPVVLDYDDAVFHAYDQHRNPLVRLMLGRKIAKLMAAARRVISGNPYIGEWARKHGARDVVELPTVVDVDRYHGTPRQHDGRPFTIGWIGSSLTSAYLEPLRPMLAELAQRLPLRILLSGANPQALDGLPVDRRAWSLEREAEDLALCDVGIMPLPDEPWERGKCGYKLIQYMASALPVIASPVGVNRNIVLPGVTGFLAEEPAAWSAALERLAHDPELRDRMGLAGRHRAEQHYSLAVAAERLCEFLSNASYPPPGSINGPSEVRSSR